MKNGQVKKSAFCDKLEKYVKMKQLFDVQKDTKFYIVRLLNVKEKLHLFTKNYYNYSRKRIQQLRF